MSEYHFKAEDLVHLKRQEEKARDEKTLQDILELRKCKAFETYFLAQIKQARDEIQRLIIAGVAAEQYLLMLAQLTTYDLVLKKIDADEARLLRKLEEQRNRGNAGA